MRTKTTIRPELKILRVLAEHKEFEQYKLPKETDFSYRTILRYLKPMEKTKWIRLVRTEASEKGGKEKKIYTLTLKGLAIAFKEALEQAQPPDWSVKWDMNKVAKKSGHLLPLVLGKWTYYRSAGLGDEFMRAFQWVVLHILNWGYDTKEFATEQFWYYIFQITPGRAKVKWLKALREDPELRQQAIKELGELLHWDREYMRVHEKSLEMLKLTNEPDWNKVLSDLYSHAPKEYSSLSAEDLSQWVTKELKKY